MSRKWDAGDELSRIIGSTRQVQLESERSSSRSRLTGVQSEDDIQVLTPKRGRIHRCRTNQATRATMIQT